MADQAYDQALLNYISAMMADPQSASLDPEELPEALRPLGKALCELGLKATDIESFALRLAQGDIDAPIPENIGPITGPLKRLQENLQHLVMIMRQVTAGDYDLKLDDAGDFADAFNTMVDRLRAQKLALEKGAYTDELTGAWNRDYAHKAMEELWKKREAFTLASVDMDNLKACNDNYGHVEGDRFLQVAYRLMEDCLPKDTYIFRYSGDQFLIVSLTLSVPEMEDLLEKARAQLRGSYGKILSYQRSFSYGCTNADPKRQTTYQMPLRESEQKMFRYRFTHMSEVVETERQREEDLDKNGLRSRAFDAFANADEKRYLFLYNMHTNISRWSAYAVRDFGLPGEYIYDANSIWIDYIHPDDRENYRRDIEAVFSGKKQTHNLSYRARTADGQYVLCTCNAHMLLDKNGSPDFFAGSITNHGMIDNVDPVTNLYNVYKLMEELRRYKTEKKPVSLLVFGINQFRRINNSYGFEFGNKVLLRFAQLLLDQVNGKGRAFRLNSVKFCVLMDHTPVEEIEALYRDICTIARNHLRIEELNIRLTLSGGSLSFESIDAEETAVLAELEYALSVSSKDGQGTLIHFDDKRHDNARRHLELIDTLIRSVLFKDFHGFFLEYQPQVRVDGLIVGAEALIRWQDESWGRVPPNDFIPILENDSCFYDLGLWILQTALREIRPILEIDPHFTISVNVSYRQMEQPNFKNDVLAIVDKMNFPTRNLTLELTEHCRSIQLAVLSDNLNTLRAAGIRISADDFGTGYSSLSLLRDLPLDSIKIDRTFISDIVENSPDQIIVKSTIQCAKDFGIHVCVEGVEDVPSLMTVDAYQPDMYQGYLYSRPIPLDALLALFRSPGGPRIIVAHPGMPITM